MNNKTQTADWTLDRDEHNIAWLWLDKAGASTNVLSAEVMSELNDRLDELDKDKAERRSRLLGEKIRLYRRRRHQGIHQPDHA